MKKIFPSIGLAKESTPASLWNDLNLFGKMLKSEWSMREMASGTQTRTTEAKEPLLLPTVTYNNPPAEFSTLNSQLYVWTPVVRGISE